MSPYSIVYADPPREVMAGSKQSRKAGDSQKSLPLSYSTMKLDEIMSMPVKEIRAKDSVLFLWTINAYIYTLGQKHVHVTKVIKVIHA